MNYWSYKKSENSKVPINILPWDTFIFNVTKPSYPGSRLKTYIFVKLNIKVFTRKKYLKSINIFKQISNTLFISKSIFTLITNTWIAYAICNIKDMTCSFVYTNYCTVFSIFLFKWLRIYTDSVNTMFIMWGCWKQILTLTSDCIKIISGFCCISMS